MAKSDPNNDSNRGDDTTSKNASPSNPEDIEMGNDSEKHIEIEMENEEQTSEVPAVQPKPVNPKKQTTSNRDDKTSKNASAPILGDLEMNIHPEQKNELEIDNEQISEVSSVIEPEPRMNEDINNIPSNLEDVEMGNPSDQKSEIELDNVSEPINEVNSVIEPKPVKPKKKNKDKGEKTSKNASLENVEDVEMGNPSDQKSEIEVDNDSEQNIEIETKPNENNHLGEKTSENTSPENLGDVEMGNKSEPNSEIVLYKGSEQIIEASNVVELAHVDDEKDKYSDDKTSENESSSNLGDTEEEMDLEADPEVELERILEEKKILAALGCRSYHFPGTDTAWRDWVIYVKNNHPVLSICFQHRLHPISKQMRVVNCFGSIVFGLALTNLFWLLLIQNDLTEKWSVEYVANDVIKSFTHADDSTTIVPSLPINTGTIALWTVGALLHFIFDKFIWFATSCACLGSLGMDIYCCHPRYKKRWNLVVVVLIMLITFVSIYALLIRVTLLDDRDFTFDASTFKDAIFLKSNTVDLSKIHSQESWDFMLSFTIEVTLAWFVYWFLIMAVLFSGILNKKIFQGQCLLLGGRPHAIVRDEKKYRRMARKMAREMEEDTFQEEYRDDDSQRNPKGKIRHAVTSEDTSQDDDSRRSQKSHTRRIAKADTPEDDESRSKTRRVAKGDTSQDDESKRKQKRKTRKTAEKDTFQEEYTDDESKKREKRKTRKTAEKDTFQEEYTDDDNRKKEKSKTRKMATLHDECIDDESRRKPKTKTRKTAKDDTFEEEYGDEDRRRKQKRKNRKADRI